MAKKKTSDKTAFEYSGYTYRKRRQDVINKLRLQKKVKGTIKSVKFNKRKVKGLWKFKAIVVK